MTPGELLDIAQPMVTQPAKVRHRETNAVLLAMYYKRDRTNFPQIEAWLLDALLTVGPGEVLEVAGVLGRVPVHPGDFLVQNPYDGTFMAFRNDEFHERFEHRAGGD